MRNEAHGIRYRLFSDPPFQGECKVRIKSDGTELGTRVFVVDSEGHELQLPVMSVSWKIVAGSDLASVELRVDGDVEAELEATRVANIKPETP